jgi:hypothetical protein
VRAFIVRPFGTKNGIDFDRVERELIDPVLRELGIEGRTTQEIARAGNIRADMFERLLLADVVIADISIHSANVHYELGIRHALRDRSTILIRADEDEVPFDLRTDRYLEYPKAEPGSAGSALLEAVRQSIRDRRPDSPVYLLLPRLEAHDPATFQVVPQPFAEAVQAAAAARDRPMLALLREEIQGMDWALSGGRLIGRAEVELGAWTQARETWEAIRASRPDDVEANLRLGTVYQRLRQYPVSSLALSRVLERKDLGGPARAEALALMGSNARVQWVEEWQGAAPTERRAAALRSAFLFEALEAYDEGFSEDMNHYYSGINALAMTTIVDLLARAEPQVWTGCFLTDDSAVKEGERIERRRRVLEAAVRRALEAASHRLRRAGGEDPWLEMTWAHFHLLTADRPAFVKAVHERARAGLGAGAAWVESSARQLRIYPQLGILEENARAGLEGLEAPLEQPGEAVTAAARVLVFSGHRIDPPGRQTPRFPASREEQARAMIRAAVAEEQALAGQAPVEGIAGAASGGDILFHEVCAELGIPTSVLLAMREHDFAARSVADAGPGWMERFRKLCDRVPPRVLSVDGALPEWLADRPDYTIWQRSNLWILHTALAREDADVTLIVLWDGQGGDGPGGTEDMVDIAKRRGVKVVHLDARELLG